MRNTLILTALLLSFSISAAPLKKKATPTPTPVPTPALLDPAPVQGVAAERLLVQNLRDPDSYKPIGWTQYGACDLGAFEQKVPDGQAIPGSLNPLGIVLPPPCSVWGLRYRAKNGYGGYGIEEQLFIFAPSFNSPALFNAKGK